MALLLCLVLTACSKNEAPHVHQERIVAFGTIVDVSTYGADEDTVSDAKETLHSEFNRLHTLWHAWKDGELYHANLLLREGKPAKVSDETMVMLQKARIISDRSGHLFNPAIGSLVALWGYHGEELPTGPPPPDAEIAKLVKAAYTLDDLTFSGNAILPKRPGITLDVGAFAKGYAVDHAIEKLRALGINNAIVNAGGDLRAIGAKGNKPWRVGIRHPRQSGLIASLTVNDNESVFTSGDYERFYMHNGKRYHHIIDPRTGYPAPDSTSVTILRADAATADGSSTALMIAGPKEWTKVAKALGLEYVMLVDTELNVHLTPAMAERIKFEVDPKPVTVIETLD